jgi:hypothetical protein
LIAVHQSLFDSEEIAPMLVDKLEYTATTTCYAGEWIFSHDHWQSGLFHDQAIQVT